MDIQQMLGELQQERERIDTAIRTLQGIAGVSQGARRRGRPPQTNVATASGTVGGRRKRRMSKEARAKMSAAARARWAKQKGSKS